MTAGFLDANARVSSDDTIALASPTVGYFRDALEPGAMVAPGMRVGVLEVLGRLHVVRAPEGAMGRVIGDAPRLARRPVGYGDVLLRLDPSAAAAGEVAAARAAREEHTENVFRSPMAGRFYGRPSPDKPPFLAPGSLVEQGQTVGLVEIMKTFNRVTYGGASLPSRCRVVEILLADGEDVDLGAPLFRYEPA